MERDGGSERKQIAHAAVPFRAAGERSDVAPILEAIGDARIVLLGEATHGTDEFYRARAEVTKWLVREKRCDAVAVEADWPDAWRAGSYARGEGTDRSAEESLRGFRRFPAWMWRNEPTVEFLEWLRTFNRDRDSGTAPVGFYGLDLYSLFASIDAVLAYLEAVDPRAAERARERYGCFDRFDRDAQNYGWATEFGADPGCEAAVIAELEDLRRRRAGLSASPADEDAAFDAAENARVVRNAEAYYRTMFRGEVSSWNLRDRHMADTLDALVQHLEKRVPRPKVVVWAHNSHLGDARATEMGRSGEWNVGQLVRERYGAESFLLGFTTFAGTVTAASRWGGEAEEKSVRRALPESYESLFHELGDEVGSPDFFLDLRGTGPARRALAPPRLERAIGVLYLPRTERRSHYFTARLPEQFDAVVHFDETHAVVPLETTGRGQDGELPETYPTAV